MTKEELANRFYVIRDALDFQIRFSEMSNTPIVTIDKEDAYIFRVLLEVEIERLKGGE